MYSSISCFSLLDVLCSGSGARLALGTTVIAYLIVYNEASAPSLLFAVLLATIYGIMSGEGQVGQVFSICIKKYSHLMETIHIRFFL